MSIYAATNTQYVESEKVIGEGVSGHRYRMEFSLWAVCAPVEITGGAIYSFDMIGWKTASEWAHDRQIPYLWEGGTPNANVEQDVLRLVVTSPARTLYLNRMEVAGPVGMNRLFAYRFYVDVDYGGGLILSLDNRNSVQWAGDANGGIIAPQFGFAKGSIWAKLVMTRCVDLADIPGIPQNFIFYPNDNSEQVYVGSRGAADYVQVWYRDSIKPDDFITPWLPAGKAYDSYLPVQGWQGGFPWQRMWTASKFKNGIQGPPSTIQYNMAKGHPKT